MPFHETTLPNGLRLIAELNDQARSVATGFFVKAGSRDETDEIAGLSHFLEHMIFKGTPRRDHLAVNRDFDRVGAKHNAQTSEEDTLYHVTCLPEYLPKAFDVLADILRPSLREDDFDTEKKVIIEEILMYLDSPMSVAYEAAKAAHFGGHSLGQSILGTVESITDLPVEKMRDYFARYYSPANIVLAFAGKSDWSRLVALAKEHCGSWEGFAARPSGGPPAARAHSARSSAPTTSSRRSSAWPTARRWKATTDTPPNCSRPSSATTPAAGSTGPSSTRDSRTGVEVGYQDYNNAGVFFTFLSSASPMRPRRTWAGSATPTGTS